MSYYAVLEATNALVEQQSWMLQRCRRRCDGPARYMVVDQSGAPMVTDKTYKKRRLGFTLGELLQCLSEQVESPLSPAAGRLLSELNTLEACE